MNLPWNAEDLTMDEERFKGTARLFPLPDLVMFPHVMQPLHIFEPRYVDLLNSALDSDGLIAMSMLAPGWESDYEGRPASPSLCLPWARLSPTKATRRRSLQRSVARHCVEC